ncbi:hypothetical protein LY76DRAFT_602347 [Colletotrichum caudatum]|nr:hypothetical protein LY76DRAFT_602347 [Colletotrichum caudatum]
MEMEEDWSSMPMPAPIASRLIEEMILKQSAQESDAFGPEVESDTFSPGVESVEEPPAPNAFDKELEKSVQMVQDLERGYPGVNVRDSITKRLSQGVRNGKREAPGEDAKFANERARKRPKHTTLNSHQDTTVAGTDAGQPSAFAPTALSDELGAPVIQELHDNGIGL